MSRSGSRSGRRILGGSVCRSGSRIFGGSVCRSGGRILGGSGGEDFGWFGL